MLRDTAAFAEPIDAFMCPLADSKGRLLATGGPDLLPARQHVHSVRLHRPTKRSRTYSARSLLSFKALPAAFRGRRDGSIAGAIPGNPPHHRSALLEAFAATSTMSPVAPLARSNCFHDTAVALLGRSVGRTMCTELVTMFP